MMFMPKAIHGVIDYEDTVEVIDRLAGHELSDEEELFLDTLSTNECRAYLVTADTILALALAAYDGKEPDLLATREPYERFERFHRLIDQNVTMGASIDDESGLLMVTLQTDSLRDGIELIKQDTFKRVKPLLEKCAMTHVFSI